MQLLRNLAEMGLVHFTSEAPSREDELAARLNEAYAEEDTSFDPCLMLAQAEAAGEENW